MSLDLDNNLAIKLGIARGLFSGLDELNSTIELIRRTSNSEGLPQAAKEELEGIVQRLEIVRSKINRNFPIIDAELKND